MWVGLFQLVEGWSRTAETSTSEKKFLLTYCLELGHQFFLAFEHELEHELFLGLQDAESVNLNRSLSLNSWI